MTTPQTHLFMAGWRRVSRGFAAALLSLFTPAARSQPAPTYAFTTLAGAPSVGAVDGTGAEARFAWPIGVALDQNGTAYVADSRNHVIRKVTAAGVVTTLAGRPGQPGYADGQGAAAQFNLPMDVAVDGAGNLYVADSENRLVRKIAPDGTVTTLAGALGLRGNDDGAGSAARFTDPRAIAVDTAGNVYVSEYGYGRPAIRKITPAGVVSTLAGNPNGYADGTDTAPRLLEPTGLAVDASGVIYVGDREVVRRVTPTGEVSTFAGQFGARGVEDGVGTEARFLGIWGLAVDAAGNLYVVDQRASTIRKITPAGVVSTLAGAARALGDENGAGGEARFAFPADVAVNAAGRLVVADWHNNLIRELTPAGAVSTLAGLSPFDSAGSVDGTGAARFYEPDGVAVGPDGNIFVADLGNHTIRRVTPAGVVTTLAGLAGAAGYADGIGSEARFNEPMAVAVDSAGNVFVADAINRVIRKVTPAGVVTTVAGAAGVIGDVDGPFATARFQFPRGLAFDAAGVLHVLDGLKIRRLKPDGQVTSIDLASVNRPHPGYKDLTIDAAGNFYLSDALWLGILKVAPDGTQTELVKATLREFAPGRLAMDRSGNLFMTELLGHRIGQLLADGTIRIIAGDRNVPVHIDGIDRAARFFGTAGIAVDGNGVLYVTSSAVGANTLRKGQPGGVPVITTQPQSQSVTAGRNVQFSVVATSDVGLSYQWHFNGGALSGATGSSLSLPAVNSAHAGDYTVVVTNAFASVTSTKASLAVTTGPSAPPSGNGGGGGGGGAPSGWFMLALLALTGLRRLALRAA